MIAWTNRTFNFDLPIELFPALLERVAGTPSRAAELVSGISEERLGRRADGSWSAKENLGHLSDLSSLDDRRLQEFLAGAPVLSAADPENRSTEAAQHNHTQADELIESLRTARMEWVRRLRTLTEDDLCRTALHPRLNQRMRLLNWVLFVAEHDDHHLALARQAILNAGEGVQSTAAPVSPAVRSTSSTSLEIPCARQLFEIPDDVTYLNCANMAPQLRRVTAAGSNAVRTKATPWKLTANEWFAGSETLRTLASQVIGSDTDSIALVPAVSYGIGIAAANLPLEAGQKIVLLDQEFPSNVYAWRSLAAKQNGKLVTVKRTNGENWTETVLGAIDGRTAIVAVPQCHWTDGSKVELEVVGERAREVGAALVIDASQSLGASVLDIDRVKPDFLVAVGYKWLLGPYGLGYLYVAPKWRDLGAPLEQSWLTRAGSEDFTRLVDYTDEYRPGARRFDMGEFPQFVSVPMAIEALEQVLDWRVERIAATLSELTEKIAEYAMEFGYAVLPAADRVDHLIGIRPRKPIPASLSESLRKAQVFVSIRGDSIRVAPHLYNTEEDIDRLFDVLRKQNA